MNPISIGELSKRTGVKVTTIRYYESIGIVSEPIRTNGGRRQYGEEAVLELTFIRHGRELGFSIDAIKELLGLRDSPKQDCEEVNRIAQRQLGEIQTRLRQLKALEVELKRIVKACDGGPISDCRILNAISDHGECVADVHAVVKSF